MYNHQFAYYLYFKLSSLHRHMILQKSLVLIQCSRNIYYELCFSILWKSSIYL